MGHRKGRNREEVREHSRPIRPLRPVRLGDLERWDEHRCSGCLWTDLPVRNWGQRHCQGHAQTAVLQHRLHVRDDLLLLRFQKTHSVFCSLFALFG